MFNIEKDVGYVVITYDDGTMRVVRTTLNPEILLANGVSDLGENLFDLDRRRFVPIEGSIQIMENLNHLEVDDFNGFINKFL